MTKLHNILETLSTEAKQEILKGAQDGRLIELLITTATRTLDGSLQEYQKVPEGDWFRYALLGGRAAGKTYALTHWVTDRLIEDCGVRVCVVVPSHTDVSHLVSRLAENIPQEYNPKYKRLHNKLELENGSTVTFVPSGGNMRGALFHYGAVMEAQRQFVDGYDGQLLEELSYATRLGKNSRIFIEGHDDSRGSYELIKYLNRCGVETSFIRTTQNKNLSNTYIARMSVMRLI